MARTLVLNVNQNKVYEAECEELEDFYKHLEVGIFDIATRKIGGTYYDMFVDDNGWFVENPIVSAVNKDGYPMLVGNIIFANYDGEGNTTSLSDEDIVRIRSNMIIALDENLDAHIVVIAEY